MGPQTDCKGRLDDHFGALAHVERRRLLYALLEENPQPATPIGVGELGQDERGRRVAMAHTHLPKLEDGGFVEWERETNRVIKGPRFEEIEPLLELLTAKRDELLEEPP